MRVLHASWGRGGHAGLGVAAAGHRHPYAGLAADHGLHLSLPDRNHVASLLRGTATRTGTGTTTGTMARTGSTATDAHDAAGRTTGEATGRATGATVGHALKVAVVVEAGVDRAVTLLGSLLLGLEH
ncbi:unnamed protein product, partial [Ectocarpus fasciculatus]